MQLLKGCRCRLLKCQYLNLDFEIKGKKILKKTVSEG